VSLFGLLAAALSLSCFGQEGMHFAPKRMQPAPEAASNPTFKVSVSSVFLTLSVRDSSTSRSLSSLGKDDFQVYEDGELQTVEQFQPTEVPFHLLLLLDVSGSTAPYLELMKKASIDFTQQLNSSDRIAVATFNGASEVIENFTGDRESLQDAINWIRSGGGTAFYDALETALTRYMRGVRGRKAVVVFTDGVDSRINGGIADGSRISFDQLLRKVQDADTVVYPILLDQSGVAQSKGNGEAAARAKSDRTAREQLQVIAEQTGGRMYAPQCIENLHVAYNEIAADLRIQYRLGYNSTNPIKDGRWRDISVRLKAYPDAEVRTRKGYFAGANAVRDGMEDW
jgi:VWFA-related protein